MTSSEFELRAAASAGETPAVVEFVGEIDAGNAQAFERELGLIVAAGAAVLDLSAATYFDSAGFEVLDRMLGAATLAVVISPASVLRTAASLMSVPFHDTVDEALAAIGTVP